MNKFVFTTLLLSCFAISDAQSFSGKLEEITSRINTDEGFADIFLKITSDTKTDSSHIYIAKGLYKNKQVGLQFEVRSVTGAGFVDGKVNGESGFATNGVRIQSIGIESDEFIKAMSELYKQSKHKKFSKQVITATAFSLNSGIADLNKPGLYKFKLFFGEEDDEKMYGEIFFNVNTEKKEIEMREKEENYRGPLIKVWSK